MPRTVPTLDTFLASDGSQMAFSVVRGELARTGEESFTTISAEALSVLGVQMQNWAVSRLIRAARKTGQPLPALHVTARLTGPDVNAGHDFLESDTFTGDEDLTILWQPI